MITNGPGWKLVDPGHIHYWESSLGKRHFLPECNKKHDPDSNLYKQRRPHLLHSDWSCWTAGLWPPSHIPMHGSGNQASCGKLLINAHLIVPGDWSVGSECWPRGSVYCWKDHVVRCDRQSAHCHWQRKQLAGWESSLTQVVIPGGWSWTVQLTFCCTILLRILAFVNTVVPGIQFAFSEGLATFQYLYEIHKGFQKSDRLISKEINTDVIWNCNFRFWPRFLNFTRVLFQ